MKRPRVAVHRTIVVVDVEGFGDRRRTTPHQLGIREGLYRAVETAFDSSGVLWATCDHEDRGDSVFILVPAEVPKALFVDSVPLALVSALRRHNHTHLAQERIRLRMAVHAGEVVYDEHGVTSASINLAFRLLEAKNLKNALAGSPGVLALITSAWFFDEVVRQSQFTDPATYRPIRVAVKETFTVGWTCLPDHPYPAEATIVSAWASRHIAWPEKAMAIADTGGIGRSDLALRHLLFEVLRRAVCQEYVDGGGSEIGGWSPPDVHGDQVQIHDPVIAQGFLELPPSAPSVELDFLNAANLHFDLRTVANGVLRDYPTPDHVADVLRWMTSRIGGTPPSRQSATWTRVNSSRVKYLGARLAFDASTAECNRLLGSGGRRRTERHALGAGSRLPCPTVSEVR